MQKSFSTEEKEIGRLSDNTIVYEKTIYKQQTKSTNSFSIAHGISNIDKIWMIPEASYCCIPANTGDSSNRYAINWLNSNSSINYQISYGKITNNNFNFYIGNWIITNGSMMRAVVTLRYTKTTV